MESAFRTGYHLLLILLELGLHCLSLYSSCLHTCTVIVLELLRVLTPGPLLCTSRVTCGGREEGEGPYQHIQEALLLSGKLLLLGPHLLLQLLQLLLNGVCVGLGAL